MRRWHPTVRQLTPFFDGSLAINGRSLVHSNKHSHGRHGFREFLGVFRVKKLLGRTETWTRERKCFQSIRTVWDISRDDRARIATCRLQIATNLRRTTVWIIVSCAVHARRQDGAMHTHATHDWIIVSCAVHARRQDGAMHTHATHDWIIVSCAVYACRQDGAMHTHVTHDWIMVSCAVYARRQDGAMHTHATHDWIMVSCAVYACRQDGAMHTHGTHDWHYTAASLFSDCEGVVLLRFVAMASNHLMSHAKLAPLSWTCIFKCLSCDAECIIEPPSFSMNKCMYSSRYGT